MKAAEEECREECEFTGEYAPLIIMLEQRRREFPDSFNTNTTDMVNAATQLCVPLPRLCVPAPVAAPPLRPRPVAAEGHPRVWLTCAPRRMRQGPGRVHQALEHARGEHHAVRHGKDRARAV